MKDPRLAICQINIAQMELRTALGVTDTLAERADGRPESLCAAGLADALITAGRAANRAADYLTAAAAALTDLDLTDDD